MRIIFLLQPQANANEMPQSRPKKKRLPLRMSPHQTAIISYTHLSPHTHPHLKLHQLDRRPRGMRQNRLLHLQRRHAPILARGILNRYGRQIRTVSVSLGIVDGRRARTSSSSVFQRLAIIAHGARWQIGGGSVMQFRECFCEIFCVHLLVGRIFHFHFPAVGRRGRGRNEK